MSQAPKKQTFLAGTAVLAMATVVVKVIGAFYKIPLNAIIGKQGFSYFNTAYEIYAVLLMVSTAGLPVAMSRMISQASAMHHYNQVRKIYTTAQTIFLGLGLVGSLLMTVFCRQLADFLNQPDAWAAIGALGPSVLLICIMSTYRGYFQGQSNMLPTSLSQVIEAVVKLVVGMAAAVILLKLTDSVPYAAAGAIFGVTASCLISALYLFCKFRRSYCQLPESSEKPFTMAAAAKGLMIIAIPITIGSAGLQILTMLETKIYMGRLLAQGITQMQADDMKGVYNMTQTIFNMPCALITPITISIIPAITANLTQCRDKAARETEESAIRIMSLMSAPCAVGLAVLSQPVTALLGGYRGTDLVLSTRLMTVLGITVFFNAVVLVTTAMLQAHGFVNRPVFNMFLGGILKLTAVYILTGNPHIGILGTPIGTLLCYIVISMLNVISMRHLISDNPRIFKNVVRSLAASLIMGVFVWGSWALLVKIGLTSRLLLCALPVSVGIFVYGAAVFFLKVLTRADCLLLPKGEKIAKFLHL